MTTKSGNNTVKWHDGLPENWAEIEIGADPPISEIKSGRPPIEENVTEIQTTIREPGSDDRWIVCTQGAINLDQVW